VSSIGANREVLDLQPAYHSSDSSAYLHQVAKGALINLSGMIIRTVLAYSYIVMLACMLPASDLDRYFLIMTVVNIADPQNETVG